MCEPGLTLLPFFIFFKAYVLFLSYLNLTSSLTPEHLFAQKIHICLQILGAKSDLLSIIGSWRKEATDEETFEQINQWIEDTKSAIKNTDELVKV